ITVNNVPINASQPDAANLICTLDRAYASGEEFLLRVEYSGFPQNNGFDSIVFTTQGGQPLVSTLSETEFAYTWWPTKDDNRDKSTADMRYTVPSSLSVAANGKLMSVTPVAGGRSEWYWKTEYPTATYLYSFSTTNYARFSSTYDWGGGVMPLEFFIYPNSNTEQNRNGWLLCRDMLATFRTIYGLYPFINEKYGIYQFAFGGGMEHQTITGQGGFSESLTAHELGHQWWGDMITCASWNHIWLNEGFATYSEALWLERKPGSTGLPALHSAMASRRPSLATTLSVYIPEPLDNADLNRIFSTSLSYRKPAWVLHMLRRVVGDATFFAILAEYRARFEYQSATTDDFRQVCEDVSGLDLFRFFDQWIYKGGYPAYSRAWRQVTVNGQTYIEVYLRQTQSAALPTFAMPMDIVVTPVSGAPFTRVVQNDARTEWFLLPVSSGVSTVQFDPTPWILSSANSSTTFVEGPPAIVRTVPEPGATLEPGAVSAVDVFFHKSVSVPAGAVTVSGVAQGPVAGTLAYDPTTRRARLSFAQPLAPDTYTVRVLDSVTETASGKALDGELASPSVPSFPSGNGEPGGIASFTFLVPPASCPGDADGDGDRDFADISSVLQFFSTVYTPSTGPGDANADGTVDFQDITQVLTAFGQACP
ncbi:MAG: M1 family aminopeptidase, partial [Planctomycetota bacterium]|nr:M1 family aminopeptidase [Planctomycetota bacterium]